MEVHRVLGNGFLEAVYQEALAIEFAERRIPYVQERSLEITYKQRPLACGYRADFICFNDVVVEVKAITNLSGNEQSQVINYLKASGIERGLLVNFGSVSLQHRRLIRSANHNMHSS